MKKNKSLDEFIDAISKSYTHEGESILLGSGMFEGKGHPEAKVNIPLSTLNRHGLIAGATGTGKTKTVQVLAEQLSEHGVPTLLMDIKGDLSGLAVPGTDHPKIQERHAQIGVPYEPSGYPVEFLSISDEPGVRLRSTVIEFGPILMSKILDLNETQSGVMSVLFKYCDDHGIPLLDLKDLKRLLAYAQDTESGGKQEIEENYGKISSATLGSILRKIVTLEQEGADKFFGEKSLEVEDLLQTVDGKGVISILRLTDIVDKPRLFSTFMLSLLAEVYEKFPEEGDIEKPKLVIVIDEAHLVFDQASKALLEQIEMVVKLIRSKGVGVIFATQNPKDIPEDVLAQLGLKIQHSLRAFTAKDRQNIKQTAENYPLSDFYDVDELITSMGIGEALVTALNEDGQPTELVHTLLRAPKSRMDVLSELELRGVIASSKLVQKYNEDIDRDSAYEILGRKMEQGAQEAEETATAPQAPTRPRRRSATREATSSAGEFLQSKFARDIGRTVTRTISREIMRGIFGVLGKK